MMIYQLLWLCIACAAVLFFSHSSEAASLPQGTTAWPDICRVMALYRTCDDTSFRVACGYKCSGLSAECEAKSMIYIPSKGKCYGVTIQGKNLWPFAMDSCVWYGGTLALLKDASDTEVFTYLVSEAGSSESKYLVGALNVGKTDTWVHVDGTEVDDSYWTSSKPSDSSSFLCMTSEQGSDYKQSSDDCGQNRAFICEAE